MNVKPLKVAGLVSIIIGILFTLALFALPMILLRG